MYNNNLCPCLKNPSPNEKLCPMFNDSSCIIKKGMQCKFSSNNGYFIQCNLDINSHCCFKYLTPQGIICNRHFHILEECNFSFFNGNFIQCNLDINFHCCFKYPMPPVFRCQKLPFSSEECTFSARYNFLNEFQKNYIQNISKLLETTNHKETRTVFLALDTGLGKTRVSLSSYYNLRNMNHPTGYCLVIAPLNVIKNAWKTEIEKINNTFQMNIKHEILTRINKKKFLIPILSYENTGNTKFNFGNHDIILTNYEMIVSELSAFERNPPSFIICDEAHKLNTYKNQSLRIDTLSKLFEKTPQKLALTGTIFENTKEELAILYNCFQDRKQLLKLYEKQSKDNKEEIIRKSIEEIKNFMIYDISSYSLDLTLVRCDFDDYMKVQLKKMEIMPDDRLYNLAETTIRQFILKPSTKLNIPSAYNINLEEDYESPKIKTTKKIIDEMVRENSEVKIVVFCNFKAPLEYLYDTLKNCNPVKAYTLPNENKLPILPFSTQKDDPIEEFKSSNSNVLLSTYEKSSVGLNLQFATKMILLDLPWTEAELQQAMSRIIRTGQKQETECLCLFYNEEKELKYSYLDIRLYNIIIHKQGQKNEIFRLQSNRNVKIKTSYNYTNPN